jgi:hypothetical protein
MPAASKISICVCDVALGGDTSTIVNRGSTNPVSWPELRLIIHLHGKNAVTNVAVIGEQPAKREAELSRLRGIYGDKAVDFLYPGAFPDIQMKAPPAVPRGEPVRVLTAQPLPDDLDLNPFGEDDAGDTAAA